MLFAERQMGNGAGERCTLPWVAGVTPSVERAEKSGDLRILYSFRQVVEARDSRAGQCGVSPHEQVATRRRRVIRTARGVKRSASA
jgi:hypothetical protein